MLRLKTKWFDKWSKRNFVTNEKLIEALKNILNDLGTVNLGGGLYKVRISKIGKGKSGGFRTIVVYRESDIAVFVYGYSKSVKSNLNNEELKYFKKLSKELLSKNSHEYAILEELGEIILIKEDS
jgi:hypothetical protein